MDAGVPYSELTPIDQLNETLERQGFAIVKDFRLTEETCNQWKDELWNHLETMIEDPRYQLDRNNPSTYPNYFQLFPLHSMLLQHWGIGHLKSAWEAREKATQIYSRIWDVNPEDLLTSFDGLSFQIAPEKLRGKGQFKGETWFHTDQSYRDLKYRCVQGYWNLEETGPNDGCLSVLSGSHLLNREFSDKFLEFGAPASNFYKLIPEELNWYIQDKGCQWRYVTAPKGCFVCWLSNTVHCGTESRLPRESPRETFSEKVLTKKGDMGVTPPRDRLVYYVSQLPRNAKKNGFLSCRGASQNDLKKRIQYYREGRLTSHWCYPVTVFPPKPNTYGFPLTQIKNVVPPELSELTDLQKRLIGF